MPADPLREKLKALVGELHQQAAIYRRGQELSNESQALAYTQAARKLAALLAESEEEPLVATVDRLQGILNRVQQALAKYAGDDAYRVPQESLPLMIVSLLSSKAALLPSAAGAVGSTVVPGGSTTGHSFTPPERGSEKCSDGCGADSDAHCWNKSDWADCEAKAKLPLGHAYCGTEDGRDCKVSVDYSPEGKCWLRCGQPRSAHKPRRGRRGR